MNVGVALLIQGGCGDQVECPRGMTGDPCRFTGDIGTAPTAPPLSAEADTSTETTGEVDSSVPPTDAPQDDGDQPDGTGDAGPEVESSDGRSDERRAGFQLALRGQSGECLTFCASHPPIPWHGQGDGDPTETPNAHIAAGLAHLYDGGPARPRLANGSRGSLRDRTGNVDAAARLAAGRRVAIPSEA
jgi:hypothetical protein